MSITDKALLSIIDGYTSEAGVRQLEREISSLCRKAAKQIIDGAEKTRINDKNLASYLGAVKVIREKISDTDEIAAVNGLAYTDFGGEMLKIEIAVFDGSGKIELTGSLGDVMKESAKIAVSCVRGMADKLGIDPDFYKNKDIHIHAPEGAVPKDGPSAGVTMMTALVSALTQRPVKRDVAMTGEITLRSNVLAIGGLKEKSMAAYKAGVKTIIIPETNVKDLDDVDAEVKTAIRFIPAKTGWDVLEHALLRQDNIPVHTQGTYMIGTMIQNNTTVRADIGVTAK